MAENKFFPKLFQAGRIGRLELKNRLVMLPIGGYFTGDCSNVTDRTIAYFVERARGGVGLITVGNTLVTPVDDSQPITRKYFTLHHPWLLPGHYHLTEAVHLAGARIGIQLAHPGNQLSALDTGSKQPLTPSGIQQVDVDKKPFPKPRAMTKADIHQMIEYFATAGDNARRSGYDMVEIHCAHGYLLNAFMSPRLNKRTDEFGGSLENRLRFPVEIIKAIHALAGANYPVGVRINASDFVPGGITIEDSPAMARMLEEAGAAYISIGMGTYESQSVINDVMRVKEGWRLPYWEAIKKAVTIPTIAAGGNRHPDFCERVIASGKADFIGMASQLLADPYWPAKASRGEQADIRYCMSCMRCLYARGGGPQVVRHCSTNAMWGRELEYARLGPAATAKRVIVIGGGPAGMEAARVASLRGHKVTLYEKGKELGGQILIAAVSPGKEKLLWLRDYLAGQLKKQGVRIVMGREITSQDVAKARADVVILATGAQPTMPDIPGLRRNAVTAWDVLTGKSKLAGKNITILGGGAVGGETAEFLAEQGKQVTIIEMLPAIAHDMEPINRRVLVDALQKHRVKVLTGQKVVKITKKAVTVADVKTGKTRALKTDHVVSSLGVAPVRTLADKLEDSCAELYVIGDCREPQTILEAVSDGFLTAYKV